MEDHIKHLTLLANAALAAGLIKDITVAVKISAAIDAFKELHGKVEALKQSTVS